MGTIAKIIIILKITTIMVVIIREEITVEDIYLMDLITMETTMEEQLTSIYIMEEF